MLVTTTYNKPLTTIMGDTEMKWRLTHAEWARLKLRDSRPALALYLVAHEGVSAGAVLGLGKTPKKWSAEMIEALSDKMINKKIPVFIGHPDGRANRTPVGYVLKSFAQETDGSKDAYAVVHFTDARAADRAKEGLLNAASIEADLSLSQTGDGWEVARVENVAALAVENGENHRPGFQRAGLVAMAHEMTETSSPPTVESPAHEQRVDAPSPPPVSPAPDIHGIIDEALADKNLSTRERDFIHNRVTARIAGPVIDSDVNAIIHNSLADLEEAKRIYRQTPQPIRIPAEINKGPADYTKPEHNKLIPRG